MEGFSTGLVMTVFSGVTAYVWAEAAKSYQANGFGFGTFWLALIGLWTTQRMLKI